MKLNHDCVRDVLLALENNLTVNGMINHEQFKDFEETKEYSNDDIVYTLLKLLEAKFLVGNAMYYDNEPHPIVSSITYNGHELIDVIRDNQIWQKTKKFVKSTASSVSITILGQVASGYLKSHLGIK